jgi:hypothetical protein
MAQDAIAVTDLPLSSPDLAPFDFYLFGHMKELLRGESFGTGEQAISAVEGILRSLEKLILTRVFPELMKSIEQCIETDGNYVL